MQGSMGGLCFSLFVPARFGTLDQHAKLHQVMRCCPACGAALVLFRDKFGEVAGRSAPGLSHASTPRGKESGGWVCTKCGVHIVSNDKAQVHHTPSPDPKHPGGSSGSVVDKSSHQVAAGPGGGRQVSPPQRGVVTQAHQGTSPTSPIDRGATSPLSAKQPIIIDDDYEIWERQVKNSFMSFLSQIRERLGHKEISLKQYQVTLCQRERQLRANEEGMAQRWNKFQQSEQNFKTKMDRLNLYKETMINQLEAKARQLTQYEQRLTGNNGFKSSSQNMFGSKTDIKGSILEFNLNSTSEDVKNLSSTSGKNTSTDGSRNTSKELWNSSATSENITPSNNLNPKGSVAGVADRLRPESAEHRTTLGITMVKPIIEFRKPQTPMGADHRDFRPHGATSANINQIYTRNDSTGSNSWGKQQPSAQSRIRLASAKEVAHPDNANYFYTKSQFGNKPLSPPASRNGSSYDVRQAYFPRGSQDRPAVHKPEQAVDPSSRHQVLSLVSHVKQGSGDKSHHTGDVKSSGLDPRQSVRDVRTSIVDPRQSTGEGRPSGPDPRHTLGIVRTSSIDPRHTTADIRQSNAVPKHAVREIRTSGVDISKHPVSNIKTSGPDSRHIFNDVRTSGADRRPPSGDVRTSIAEPRQSSSSDIRHSSNDIRLLGNVIKQSSNDIRYVRPNIRHNSIDGRPPLAVKPTKQALPIRIALPPQHKPLKSALKSPDSAVGGSKWPTQSHLHVTTGGDTHTNKAGTLVTTYMEHDNVSLSPSERERSVSGLSDLSPTYTTSGYASDRETSLNGVLAQGRRADKEKHNVSFDDVVDTSSPQGTVERDTRPPWMKRRSRRLTEV